MILRSQLRMNKNIVFPFISCILIMFTLLVLLHKSSDELMTVRKELNLCREQYESTFAQLQSAIDLKLRLERSLENAKNDGKQKADNIQAQLEQERKDRQRNVNEANSKYDSLNTKFGLLQTENADLKGQKEKLNNELSNADMKLKEAEKANEMNNRIIHDLQEQLKTLNASILAQKPALSNDAGLPASDNLKGASSQNFGVRESLSPTTPSINQAAVNHQVDDSLKQVPPPPDAEKENPAQKEMLQSLNMGIVEQIKSPQENVGRPPVIRNEGNIADNENVNGEAPRNDENTRNLRKPPNFDQQNKAASSVSNNAAENPGIVQPQLMPINEKKVAPKMKDYNNVEYDNNNMMAEDEGEMEYQDNGNKKDIN